MSGITSSVYPTAIRPLFTLIKADMNSTADQPWTAQFAFSQYRITEIWASNASVSLAALTKTMAVRTAAAGGGAAIVTAQGLSGLVTSANQVICTLALSDLRTDAVLYTLMSAGTGVVGTCDLYCYGEAIT